MSEVNSVKVRLDWARLLGFDQADKPRAAATFKAEEPWQTKIGPKFGIKPGVKVGVKVGIKAGLKLSV